jgi:GntR family transcriptional regulator, transcriptional repressor for pyruvate dehydrogenase complex
VSQLAQDATVPLARAARGATLAATVTATLHAKIDSGEWAPRTQVPTEASLAQQLSVSRATVREALSRLKHSGLIYAVQGKGAFVTDEPASRAFQLIDAEVSDADHGAHVFELRALIEQNCAALAATRRSPADIRAMKRALKEMEREQAAGRLGLEADIAFHRAIARASGNPALAQFADFIGKQHREYLQIARLSALKAENRLQDVADEHRRIAGAIEARDAEAARRATAEHLDNGARRMLRGIPL